MKIAFIGLGHMGFPMAKNLLTAEHTLKVFDINPDPMDALTKLGATPCPSAMDTVSDAEIIISIGSPKGNMFKLSTVVPKAFSIIFRKKQS